MTVGLALFAVFTIFWLTFLIQAAYHGAAIHTLKSVAHITDKTANKVSVIIAARNEAVALRMSLPRLLKTGYPAVEFIIINDRSTDDSRFVLQGYAAKDSRFRIIDVADLPRGWLGKVHALNEGIKIATGEWLLLSDADVHFEPAAIGMAVEKAVEQSLDHLLLLPKMRAERSRFLIPIFNLCFGMMFISRIKARDLGKAGSSAFGGVGAFNLIRRSLYDRSEGLEWLKLEVLDDVGVGLLMKRAGGKAGIFASAGEVHLEWYASIKETIRGLEKNAFAGFARYSIVRAVATIVFLVLMSIGALVVAVALDSTPLLGMYLVLFLLAPAVGILLVGPEQDLKVWHGLFVPLGLLFIALILARSTWRSLRQRGVYWRETFYPIDELRKGQRVKL